MDRMTLDQALFQRDGYQRAYERCRAELDAARARVAELEQVAKIADRILRTHDGGGIRLFDTDALDLRRALDAKADR